MQVLIYTMWPVTFWRCPASQVERLRKRFPEITFVHAQNEAEGYAGIVDTDVAFSSMFGAEMLSKANKLRWVHSTAAAVGTLPLMELAARKILITNSKGIQAVPMAEHVMAGLLVLARRFDLLLAAQRDRRWIQNDISIEA
ncbi:MAG: hypothetical protein HY646_04570, partial [Acidobacteria bacterium]|nr:hypothetical protein [Acidobacteriota bacterium]